MKQSPHNPRCEHTGIAHSSIGAVTVCNDRNIVHLSLSHVTLRLTPEAFRNLGELLRNSQGQLEQAFHAVEGSGANIGETIPHPPLH